MKISDYNYDLPESLIAKHPPKQRGTSRLLVLNRSNGQILDKKYSDIVDFLSPGDVLVLNNTLVIKARLYTVRESDGAKRELVLLEKHGFDTDWKLHHVLYRGKLHVGDVLTVGGKKLTVQKIEPGGVAVIKSEHDLLKLAGSCGFTPLPPYLHRDATKSDILRYQTVWAKKAGSVAAPTASLNMTQDQLQKILQKKVKVVFLTLHVGLGTFLPIRTSNVEDHVMHKEYFEVPKETVEAIREAKDGGGRVVALGTTVTRTLEYCSDNILKKPPQDLSGEADIFIYPGYKFHVIDGLITNYHAPKSTVLMLAASFAGWDNLLCAYNHAIQERYKFLSYGDSMLIL